jgi:hypothetical protein
MKHFLSILWGVLILEGVLTVTPAYAYLDPGTGSMILQLLLGGVAGLVVIFKMYWARIKEFFGGGSKDHSSSEDNESDK